MNKRKLRVFFRKPITSYSDLGENERFVIGMAIGYFIIIPIVSILANY